MGLQFKLRVRRAAYNRTSPQRIITALTVAPPVVVSDEVIPGGASRVSYTRARRYTNRRPR